MVPTPSRRRSIEMFSALRWTIPGTGSARRNEPSRKHHTACCALCWGSRAMQLRAHRCDKESQGARWKDACAPDEGVPPPGTQLRPARRGDNGRDPVEEREKGGSGCAETERKDEREGGERDKGGRASNGRDTTTNIALPCYPWDCSQVQAYHAPLGHVHKRNNSSDGLRLRTTTFALEALATTTDQ